jgi:hypothetical protein
MFSPKVLDRAFTLEFREVNFGDYPPKGTDKSWTPEQTEELRQNILEDLRNGGKFCAEVADKDEVKKALQDLGGKKAELENSTHSCSLTTCTLVIVCWMRLRCSSRMRRMRLMMSSAN